ncbi:MAG: hypothetical protein WCC60_23460 [Ilumatobacteraceae bacterium]
MVDQRRVAVVSGANRGIGRMIAQQLPDGGPTGGFFGDRRPIGW